MLLVAHGTRDPLGIEQVLTASRQVASLVPDIIVETCFLELAEPTIAEAVDRAVDRGVRRLTVSPLLLLAAGHIKRDIPLAVADAARRHAGLEIRHAPHLGCHEHVLELSALRFREALANQNGDLASTVLLIVGRGSLAPEANSELARFARLRWERTPVGWLETCYTAMTRPLVESALPVVAALPFERVVVQPHLLFEGELMARLRRQVEAFAPRSPIRSWIVTQPLGPHELLARAVIEHSGIERDWIVRS